MNEESNPKNMESPRSWLERLSHALLREPQDREQLVTLLRDAEQRNLLDAEALGMIEGVLQVADMQVKDIMIPRSKMITVEQNARLEASLHAVIESGHSRFPVLGENGDEVIGILLAKDLLSLKYKSPEKNVNIRDIIRPAIFVPESKRLDSLLQEFRLKHNHMAIVVDEYGGVSGLVTIEDVLEQIVGDIEDEYDTDDDDSFITQHSDTEYTIKALTPIDDFNKFFNADLNDEEFNTIGGLIMKHFGHLPKRGETATIGEFRFKVLNADKRRIRLLQMTVKQIA